MIRRLGTVAAAGALLAATAVPSAASARTKTVTAGPPTILLKIARSLGVTKAFDKKYNPDIDDFFIHRVTINSGDTIKFVINGFHTVDFPAKGGGDLPLIIPGATVTGVNDAAGDPFWFNGRVPGLGFNPPLFGAIGGHTYNGGARVDTGVPAGSGPPKPYPITFTKPGVYKYYCDVHPGMVGYVVVEPKGARIPSARQDAAVLRAQATSDVRAAKRLARTRIHGNNVSLGVSAPHGVELFQMFPATLRVKAGTVVTFSMSRFTRESHTASFGPTPYLMALAKAFMGGPAIPGNAAYPSSPGQPIVLGSKSHGNGFANTGVLDRDPSTQFGPSSKIRFTQAGTYHFVCLIHPDMRGTIIVKP